MGSESRQSSLRVGLGGSKKKVPFVIEGTFFSISMDLFKARPGLGALAPKNALRGRVQSIFFMSVSLPFFFALVL